MRILKVIHGYPPLYNAGSEVYSQTLCVELSKRHEVHVFTREENPFVNDGVIRHDKDNLCSELKLHIVNAARVGINYNNQDINRAFSQTVEEVKPDVAHIGHLNHLSLGIVDVLADKEIPIIFTLHDFWLMCLRGQFIQVHSSLDSDVYPLCDGQDDNKCADKCMRRFCANNSAEIDNWQEWVAGRMSAVRRVAELTDLFIAPAKSLAKRFCDDFPMPVEKIKYLDYGFDRKRLTGRVRVADKNFVFGYIGTHIPGKGVHHLLQAFCLLAKTRKNCDLHIWGRATVNTNYLKQMVLQMPKSTQKRIHWMGEYSNIRILEDVFNHIDAIVVPSIWMENSPLVIHEAQQCGVPVIAADMGGMAEYVEHEKNGLLFKPRCPEEMALQMERLAANPEWSKQIGMRGYLYDKSGDVPDIAEHAIEIEKLYERVIHSRNNAKVDVLPVPWRITFDTNPDHCNYHCTMCEEHSPYSPLQFQRQLSKSPKRVMPFDMIARSIESMSKKGLREIIPSTMGEPLLYKKFEDIIALCKKTGVMLNLTTNGSFPKLGALQWGKLLVPVSSDIKISWNGACKNTHEAIMKNASWEDMLENARILIAVRDAHALSGGNRCRITFQMTFMESNFVELPDLIYLAASLGVDRVKGHHLWAHFAEIKDDDMRRSDDSRHRWNDIVVKSRAAAAACRLPNGEQVKLDNIDFLELDSNNSSLGKCPFLGKEVWISAEGRFNPCCAPDAERRTLGEFGNVNETNLLQIWEGENYRDLIKNYRSRGVCQKCNMREKT